MAPSAIPATVYQSMAETEATGSVTPRSSPRNPELCDLP